METTTSKFSKEVNETAEYYHTLLQEYATHPVALRLALEKMYNLAYKTGYKQGEKDALEVSEIQD